MDTWFNFILQTPLEKANWQFKKISDVRRPILDCWMGYLPMTKEARHILSVTKLTGWQAPSVGRKRILSPEKVNAQVTHDIVALYQLVNQSKMNQVLFHLQLETNDTIAIKLTEILAKCFIQCIDQDKNYLLETQHHQFWLGVTSLELHHLNQPVRIWSAFN